MLFKNYIQSPQRPIMSVKSFYNKMLSIPQYRHCKQLRIHVLSSSSEGQRLSFYQIMQRKPALAQYFIDFVNALGGENCKSWTQVARSLYNTHQYKVDKPESLKSIYEYLTKQTEDFTQKEIGTMISVFIEYRGDNIRSLKRFEELVGKTMARGRFINQVKREIGKVLKQIIQMFTRRKKQNLLLLRNRPERSVLTMVQAIDLKDQTDKTILDIQLYGSKLEQVMYHYSKLMHLDRTQIYSELRQIVTRRQMEYIIYYMQYLHELKLISVKSKEQDYLLLSHPLLLKSIELNEQTPVFKALISKTDWFDKYDMYNTVDFQDNSQFKVPVEQLFPNSQQTSQKPILQNQQIQIKQFGPKKRIKLQKETENQFKMVRGKLMKEGDLVQRGWKTIIFKNDEDDDNADFNHQYYILSIYIYYHVCLFSCCKTFMR